MKVEDVLISIPVFPRLGAGPSGSTTPAFAKHGPVHRSQFLPDEAVGPHPRHITLSINGRRRLEGTMEMHAPVFRDERTPWPFHDPTVRCDYHEYVPWRKIPILLARVVCNEAYTCITRLQLPRRPGRPRKRSESQPHSHGRSAVRLWQLCTPNYGSMQGRGRCSNPPRSADSYRSRHAGPDGRNTRVQGLSCGNRRPVEHGCERCR